MLPSDGTFPPETTAFQTELQQAQLLQELGSPQEALQILCTVPDAHLNVQGWLLKASILHQLLRTTEALEALEKAEQQSDTTETYPFQIKAIEILQALGGYDAARTRQMTLIQSMSHQDERYLPLLLDVCSTLLLQSSLEDFQQVFEGLARLNDLEKARVLKQLGDVMCSVKRYSHGMGLFQQALELVPDTPQNIQQRVEILNGIAGVSTWTAQPQLAIPCYEENIRLFEQSGNLHGQIQQRINIAKVAVNIPRYRYAQQVLEEAIDLAVTHQMPRLAAQAHWMMMNVRTLSREEVLNHLEAYVTSERALQDTADPHEPILLQQELRQHQQNSDFQKSLRLELESAYQKLSALHEERQRLYERLEKQAEEFEHLANTDPLTGLPNRRLFFSQFEREFARVRRTMEHFSVVLMDIDHFKSVNDTYSHKVGDLVLKRVADLLQEDRRGSDLVARYGGEEFVLLLPGADAAGAYTACLRIQHKLKIHLWKDLMPDRNITMSFGICSNTRLASIDQVLMQADEHLYEAKRRGRNCIVSEEPKNE
ncbi:tetratricopeptide repeat-containing diguanylate cyclase [Deinococcus cellulosilyticus]|uniref:GGDEF domain-containing protein n=1 Tax=Deinococcus cellulosilyticus (strain DSM 18568 / NBRC 106333 / KACC 11606 / 5516J-15) TaxID=1223518 RepID=A0A511N2K1_DEIC1|nr:diguanylate cyclase [Deinococcus cellulosilyticus]GEM46737.1 hypothetical protein DC3_23720 [Deinococcus cellulosilyticus NBRC 106333 = KACC 11606]